MVGPTRCSTNSLYDCIEQTGLCCSSPATQENHLFFGGCPVGESRQATFTLSNHSPSAVFRFKWPDNAPGFTFTPQRGHLHPQCTKDITVIFKASTPVALSAQSIFGKLQKISFSQPLSQVKLYWPGSSTSVEVYHVVFSACYSGVFFLTSDCRLG